MQFYKVLLLFSVLQTTVPGLLALGCWRWWCQTRHWPFLLLVLCGGLWFGSGVAMFVGTNLANFGKTPEQIAHDQAALIMQLRPAIYCFNLTILLLCAVAGVGLFRVAPVRTATQPDTTSP